MSNQWRELLQEFNNPGHTLPGIKDKKAIADLYPRLSALIRECARRYHALVESLLTDPEYDRLSDFLLEIEKTYPKLKTKDTPTEIIGADPELRRKDVIFKHPEKMYSLDKVYSIDDLAHWLKATMAKIKHPTEITIEEKLDGLAFKLIYHDGVLKHAVFRGKHGIEGIDVVNHIRQAYKNNQKIRGIPLQIDVKKPDPLWWPEYRLPITEAPGIMTLIGELGIREKEFKEINELMLVNGKPPYVTLRHAAAGLANARSFSMLTFVVHGVLNAYTPFGPNATENSFSSNVEAFEWLEACCGFNVIQRSLINVRNCDKDLQRIVDAIMAIEARRPNLDYAIDGAVVKIDDRTVREFLGYTKKYPKWAMAYKFVSATASTLLETVEWTVGRTGILTPIARFKPVLVGKVLYSYATLHNAARLKTLDLRNGDTIIIKRAGDVIPEISGVIRDARVPGARQIKIPELCPSCGGELSGDEKRIYCGNYSCYSKVLERICYALSKSVFDLKRFRLIGKAQIEKAVRKNYIWNAANLFLLSKNELRKFVKCPDNVKKDAFDKKLDGIISELSEVIRSGKLNWITAVMSLSIPGVNDVFLTKFNTCYDMSKLPELKPIATGASIRESLASSEVMKTFTEWLKREEIIEALSDFKDIMEDKLDDLDDRD